MNLLRRLYAPDFLLKPAQKRQEHYPTRDIYAAFMKVAWPAMVESVLVGLVNFIDSVMVSTLGYRSVAAVGLTSQPRLIFFAVFLALNIGVTAIVSRRKGEERREDANRCLAQAVSICVILGIILVSVAIAFAEPLLRFAGAMDDTIDEATIYFRIIMVGVFFTALSTAINAAQRGAGNTRISMTTNLTANIVNVIFNALLINGMLFFPKLGVAGAAIATLLGNITACVMSIVSVSKKDGFLFLRPKMLFHFDRENLSLIVRIASSAAVEQVFLRIGFFVFAMIVNNLGTIATSTHTICMNIMNLSFCFGDGLGVAASSMVGQNLGRERPDMSIIYGKTGQRVGVVVSLILMLIFIFGGESLMNLFMTGDENVPEIIETGVRLLLILAAVTPAQISQVIYSGCVRGAGDTKFAAVTSLVSVAIVRPILSFLFCYPLGFGLIGAWCSILIDQYTRLGLMAWRFSSGKWARIKV